VLGVSGMMLFHDQITFDAIAIMDKLNVVVMVIDKVALTLFCYSWFARDVIAAMLVYR
jgi:hypothetical protein